MKDLPAWQRWGDGELAYSPRRGRHAVKVSLASTLALVVAVRYNWPHPAWVTMMILPGMLPVLGAAIQTCMGGVLAVLLGGVMSLLLALTFIQEPVLLSVAFGLLIFGVVYGVTGPLGPAVFVDVGITTWAPVAMRHNLTIPLASMLCQSSRNLFPRLCGSI